MFDENKKKTVNADNNQMDGLLRINLLAIVILNNDIGLTNLSNDQKSIFPCSLNFLER
jgi:hypothetical protein